jgi:hypothetical protein
MLIRLPSPVYNVADVAVSAPDPAAVTPLDPPAETLPDPAVEPPTEPAQPAAPAKTPWFLERISAESGRARQAEERAAAAERRASEAEALAQRLQAGNAQPPVQQTPPRTDAPPQDLRGEIQREATAQRLYEDSVELRNKGLGQFGAAFGDTIRILQSVGATTDDFISDAMAVDKANAHSLLHTIAQDPERALALANMNSRQRIAELTRMTVANAAAEKTDPPLAPTKAPPAKTVSKAPAPPPPVEPSASKVVDWRSDAASDADFDAGFQEMLKKRSARR